MNDSTIDQLLASYRAFATTRHQNDASRANRAANEMLLIARRVAHEGPEAISRFSDLVHADDPYLAVCAAEHLLDFMEPAPKVREAALAVIERASGEQGWLENWRAEQQDE